MPFLDRVDAGKRLADRLGHLDGDDVVVLGVPRGGVPVAAAVAETLRAPLDVVVVRKLSAPFRPELVIGAEEVDAMRIDVNGVGIDVAVDGPEGGPAVLLLHGWPDSHVLWRNQVPVLTDAGYRVITPDQRGFGASDRPADVADYRIRFIVGDAIGVLDHLGVERAHVVGHDWGAAVAWAMAGFAPDRVDHLVALSVGHPSSFRAAGLEQREKSWYMLLFQFPGVAERWLSDDDWANFRAWGRHPDADAVIERLAEDGALTAGLNWYRANLPPEALVELLAFPPVSAPSMGIWSTDEFALTEQSMTGSERFVNGPWRYERVEGAGHWIMLDAPDRVNELLLDFLGKPE